MSVFRQVCRACHNVCFVIEGTEVPNEGYRCEACDAAKYERRDFEGSIASVVMPSEPTEPTEPTEPAEPTEPTEPPSEARPSAEPKSADLAPEPESMALEAVAE